MRTLLFISVFLFSKTIFGQGHNDLKEYGYKGHVKRITIFYYDTLSFDEKNIIYSERLWRNKFIYSFDQSGNFDSILTYTQLPMYKDTVYVSKTFYFKSNSPKFAIRTNGNNEVTDTVRFIWLSDTSYQTIETSVRNRQKILSDLILNSNFRDKSGKYTGYNERDSIEFSEKYENIINQNGLFTRSYRTNLLENTTLVVGYKYSDFDKFGNPKKVLLTNLLSKKVFRIVLRKFDYYD